MNKKCLLLFALYLVSVPFLGAQQDKMKIAIMDLQNIGVSQDTSKTVSDLLRTELLNTGLFTVIERAQMDKLVKEQGVQQSGLTENDYAVHVGKLLSARKVLFGTVNKLGDAFIINARIVDVELGVADFAESATVKSESELASGCRTLAVNLASRIDKNAVKQMKVKKNYVYPYRKIAYVSGGVSLACLGAGLYFNFLADRDNKDASKLYDEYVNADSDFGAKWDAYKNRFDLAKKEVSTSLVLYVCSGVTAAGIAAFFIRKPAKEAKVSFLILPDRLMIASRF